MGKRKAERRDEKLEQYTGTRGMEVLHAILFYGFEHMVDIVTLASMSKALKAWAEGQVYTECAMQTFVKLQNQEANIQCHGGHMPTVALLQAQPRIYVVTSTFKPPTALRHVKHVNYSAYSAHCTCLMLLTYDGDLGGTRRYQIFSNPPSHIAPEMEFVFDENDQSKFSAIRVATRLLKQDTKKK